MFDSISMWRDLWPILEENHTDFAHLDFSEISDSISMWRDLWTNLEETRTDFAQLDFSEISDSISMSKKGLTFFKNSTKRLLLASPRGLSGSFMIKKDILTQESIKL